MAPPKVFFVHLRRPASASENPDEQRDDPFYEFGSFGSTKCHSSNLLHPRHAEDLKGARLAFIQGGPLGSRLVFLTPPIRVKVWSNSCEAKWTPHSKPFRYTEAPLLISNVGGGDFPLIKQYVRKSDCATLEGGLSSLFRSRAQPLPPELANEVIKLYERRRAKASPSELASKYDEALPWSPPRIDRDRKTTYQWFIAQLQSELDDTKAILSAGNPRQRTRVRSDCGRSRHRKSGRRSC